MTAHRVWRAAVRVWNAIPLREPWRVLVPLLVFHWLALVAFTTRVNHNGWLFYQGGDQIWFWTTSWLMTGRDITEPVVSHGWSLVLAPLALVAGPAFVNGLPGALVLQVIVLAPIALWCVYELGARIGGRMVGYTAAFLWTVVPYAVIPLFEQRYHDRYVDQFLPHPLGLTAMADQPTVVCLLASAVFTVRAIHGRDPRAAALAGLLAGFATLMKPSSLLFLLGVFAATLLARRWRETVAFAVALAPALGALTLWKQQGFGYIPAFTYQEEVRVALGVDTITSPYDRYVDIDWDHLHLNLLALAEVFFSLRVLQWLPIAGAIAVARRSIPIAVFLSLWFWAFFVIKGSAFASSVDSGSFFRFLMPVFPVLVLMAASLPVLVPRWGQRWAERTRIAPPRHTGRAALIAGVLALGVAPLVAAAAVSPLRGADRSILVDGIAVPVDGGLDLRARAGPAGRVLLRWDRPDTPSVGVFYKLFRTQAAMDTHCGSSAYGGADVCDLTGEVVRITRATIAADQPGRGPWTYRVGAAANWVDDPQLGDVFLLSKPVTVTVR
jgi:hypothetical protein